jgi:hypothetical protein
MTTYEAIYILLLMLLYMLIGNLGIFSFFFFYYYYTEFGLYLLRCLVIETEESKLKLTFSFF